MTWREHLISIMTDKTTGATGLVDRTCDLIVAFAAEIQQEKRSTWAAELRSFASEILISQSGIASLVNLFNLVFVRTEREQNPVEAAEILRRIAHDVILENREHGGQISRQAAALVPDQGSLLTISASSMVQNSMQLARQMGRTLHVICMESRPFNEGRGLAQTLVDMGVKTTLVVDSAAYLNLSKVQLVVVGADSLGERGVVGKLGTAGLAVCSQSLGIPFYVLADTRKIWPAYLGEQPIHERVPADVWPEAPAGLVVQNHYFDITPWPAVSGVITERGVFSADDVRRAGKSIRISATMQEIIAEARSVL